MDDGSGIEAANNNHVKLSEAQLVHSEFGAPLDECYKLAVRYYKDKEKSGDLAILYEDRVKLMALNKQVGARGINLLVENGYAVTIICVCPNERAAENALALHL